MLQNSLVAFQNPIIKSGQDPWIIKHNNIYYLIEAINGEKVGISIRASVNLTDLGLVKPQLVWQPTPYSAFIKDLWAPELHYLKDSWYIYYSASDGDNANHRTFVLRSYNDTPYGPYEHLGKIYDPKADFWSIDSTVFEYHDQLYLLWSGWMTQNAYYPQNIYIAPMQNPWTLAGERVLISTPEYWWEKTVASVNEAPQILQNNGQTFLVYAADASWGPQKLGLISNIDGNILNPNSWKKTSSPVFEQGMTNVYGPGHPSFVKSPDDSEDWIVYHAKKVITLVGNAIYEPNNSLGVRTVHPFSGIQFQQMSFYKGHQEKK